MAGTTPRDSERSPRPGGKHPGTASRPAQQVVIPLHLVRQFAQLAAELAAYASPPSKSKNSHRRESKSRSDKPISKESAQVWMRSLERGTARVEKIEEHVPGVSIPDLRLLQREAKNGKPAVRNRAVTVLAYQRGISSVEIRSFLGISHRTVFRFIKAFRGGGAAGLFSRRTRSDKKSNIEPIRQAVFALLHSPPALHGFNRTSWRLADLQQILTIELKQPISCDVIRTIIKDAGWRWRHARTVLTSNDPEYREKVEAIKRILAQLQPNEAFFSIDEFGPFAIKRKGGRKRVPPKEQYTIPQWQKSKGCLILTAALELSRNRVTHFFSKNKNTAEMIRMADILRESYRGFRTIYLSWDAASWHMSKDLAAHLEAQNAAAEKEGVPIIKMAPLPAGAQFLNVIESIFSGMARAIIHNSDYASPEAAMRAIDAHFEKRNEYFATHPKRAGKRIWGMELVPSEFAEGHNCKDPAYQFPF